jgi:hypothetical protein
VLAWDRPFLPNSTRRQDRGHLKFDDRRGRDQTRIRSTEVGARPICNPLVSCISLPELSTRPIRCKRHQSQ